MRSIRQKLGRFEFIILGAALALRVILMVTVFASAETYSGDGATYIGVAQNPWRLGIPPGISPASPDYDPTFPTKRNEAVASIGPVYPVFLIPFFYGADISCDTIAPFVAARIAQAVLDSLTVLLIYLSTLQLFNRRTARIAMAVQAFDLRYIFTAGTIATETLFILLIVAFIAAYQAALEKEAQGKLAQYALAGVLLGFAILTRPVPLLFPALLILHALVKPSGRKLALRGAATACAAALLVITPWIIRTSIVRGEFIPVTDSGFVHFFRSTRSDGDELSTHNAMHGATEADIGYGTTENPNVEGDEYISAGMRNILENPFGWAWGIIKRLGATLLQPFGTIISTPRGADIRDTIARFTRGEASMSDVLAVPGFWRRLLMYIWHYWALFGAAAGAVLSIRERWWQGFPLMAWALYTLGLMSLLLVEPRYLFPAMFVFSIYAAHATARLWDALMLKRGKTLKPDPTL